jgi:hypothetical protein
MSKTIQTTYSKHALGVLKANKGWLSKLNNNFNMPASIPLGEVGTATVQMWDTVTTGTPTKGTLTSDGAANLQVSLTLANTYAAIQKGAEEAKAMMYSADDMLAWNAQAADALYKVSQGEIIADLIAATPGLSKALGAGATGWVDGVIPSAATIPDIINCIVAPVAQVVERVRSRNGGSNDGIVIVADEVFAARLGSICSSNYAPGYLTMNGQGGLFWQGIAIDVVSGETNFGGASHACLYVLAGRGYAFDFKPPVVFWETATGWGQRPDGFWEYQLQFPRAYGLANAQFLGEITSPAS